MFLNVIQYLQRSGAAYIKHTRPTLAFIQFNWSFVSFTYDTTMQYSFPSYLLYFTPISLVASTWQQSSTVASVTSFPFALSAVLTVLSSIATHYVCTYIYCTVHVCITLITRSKYTSKCFINPILS